MMRDGVNVVRTIQNKNKENIVLEFNILLLLLFSKLVVRPHMICNVPT